MIPHLSTHPHPFRFPHTSHHPRALSLSLSLSCLFLYFFFPQIIANHHMQSISFASGGDPVSHPTHALSLSPSPRLLSTPHLFHVAYPSFLSSVIVSSRAYHSVHLLPPWFGSLRVQASANHFLLFLCASDVCLFAFTNSELNKCSSRFICFSFFYNFFRLTCFLLNVDAPFLKV